MAARLAGGRRRGLVDLAVVEGESKDMLKVSKSMDILADWRKSVPRMHGTDSLSMTKKSMRTEELSGRKTGRTTRAMSFVEPEKAVSYTHLTLPTICSV